MVKKQQFKSEEVRAKVKKVYADAKAKGKYVPPPVARAIALSMLAKKQSGKQSGNGILGDIVSGLTFGLVPRGLIPI